MWLLDPRPDLPTIVRHGRAGLRAVGGVEHAGDAGAAHPRLPRAGQFVAKDNRARGISAAPARRARAASTTTASRTRPRPSAGEAQGRGAPAGGAALHPRARLNEMFRRRRKTSASSCRAGCTTADPRAAALGLADAFGARAHADLLLNVTYPLVPEEIAASAPASARAGGRGRPARLHRAGDRRSCAAPTCTKLHGKDVLPMAGEYTPRWCCGPRQVPRRRAGSIDARARGAAWLATSERRARRRRSARPAAAAADLLHRLPRAPGVRGDEAGAAQTGPVHVSADIGCHAFATFAAVQHRQHDPRLRHELASARRSRPCSASAPSPSWATAASGTTACSPASPRPVQQGRRRADHHEERLHLGDRHAGAAVLAAGERAPRASAARMSIENTLRAWA
jgi:indolepyruvate ferredoxin oxidoreductase, alpha subunit